MENLKKVLFTLLYWVITFLIMFLGFILDVFTTCLSCLSIIFIILAIMICFTVSFGSGLIFLLIAFLCSPHFLIPITDFLTRKAEKLRDQIKK